MMNFSLFQNSRTHLDVCTRLFQKMDGAQLLNNFSEGSFVTYIRIRIFGVRYFPEDILPRVTSQGKISQVATSQRLGWPSEAPQAAMEGGLSAAARMGQGA